jgi:hypothetical protein
MSQMTIEEKYKRAAKVICKQGMVQFPVSDTAISIITTVVGDNEEELDLIYAFREKPSQTMDQLMESSGMSEKKISNLPQALQKRGLFLISRVPRVS